MESSSSSLIPENGHGRLIDAARRDADALDDAAAQPSDGSTLAASGKGHPTFQGPPPDSFTGYRILKEIHRGGQGVVYQALQESTKRKVAIKVMKEGPFASSADRARFEREVQILGQLNHPSIVAIHDTGVAAGCHYFAMDYISGQPLDVYMASGERSLEHILRMFCKICDGINAAHLRGVIHRDLKPSNIRIDARGEPHILAFGLAKVPGSDADASVMTLTGQFVGSLPWASPEQAAGVPGNIDVRTDVYSLGVIIYQMLTGKFPYEVVGNMRDVLDRIMTVEPLRPSAICPHVNDEVETIVLKCLSKEQVRRYQSAGELARDVERYLAGEPIEAKRDSGWYMFKKTIYRYRTAAAVSASLIFVIVGALAVTLVFWQQTTRQRDRALAAERSEASARTTAEQARGAEAAQREVAETRLHQFEQERDRAQAAEKLAGQWLAELAQVRAEAEQTPQARPDLLPGQAPPSVPPDVVRDAEQPVAPLGLLEALFASTARTPEERGHVPTPGTPDRPGKQGGPAAQAQVRVKAAALVALAQRYLDVGQYGDAEAPLRAALEIQRSQLGDDHPEVATTIMELASVLRATGELAEAEALLREALETRRAQLGDEHPEVAETLAQLGWVLRDNWDLAGAEPAMREALAIRRRMLGNDHPDTASSLVGLGWVLRDRGELDVAEGLFREAVEIRRRVFGDEHPLVSTGLNNLALVLARRGAYEEAEALYRDVLERSRRAPGDGHPSVTDMLANLAGLRQAQGDLDGAEHLYRQVLETRVEQSGRDHPQVAKALEALGYMLVNRKGEFDEAETLFREALEITRKLYGERSDPAISGVQRLAYLYRRKGDLDASADLCREVLEARRALHGNEHRSVAHDMRTLASVLRSKGETEEARGLFVEALELQREFLPPAHPTLMYTLIELGGLLKDEGDAQAAQPLLREALEIATELYGADDRASAGAASMLGMCLLDLEHYEEAEGLLLEAYRGLKLGWGADNSQTLVTLHSLIRLYEARDQPEKASEYRALLPRPAERESPAP